MKLFQNFFIFRIVIALGWAWSFAKVVSVYAVFDFFGAPYVSFIFVFLGFLFLSQKYTLYMLLFCFALGGYVTVQVSRIQVEEQGISQEYQNVRKLFLLMMRYRFEGDDFLDQLKDTVGYCQIQDCPPLLKEKQTAQFWIYELGDKDQRLWYINDQWQIFFVENAELKGFELQGIQDEFKLKGTL